MKKTISTFVAGRVISGAGKRIATLPIVVILKTKAYGVNIIEANPYLNVDARTMNTKERG